MAGHLVDLKKNKQKNTAVLIYSNEPLHCSQGLYHCDKRFGPGVFSYPDGCQDVGLWVGERLLKLCAPVEEGFSLKSFAEYAAYMDPETTPNCLTQVHDHCCLTHTFGIGVPARHTYSFHFMFCWK